LIRGIEFSYEAVRDWASALMRIDPSVLSKTDPPTKSAMLESYHGAIYA
jgi:hypothetical protein